MARSFNTPPADLVVDAHPREAMTILDRVILGATTAFTLGALWLLIEVIS